MHVIQSKKVTAECVKSEERNTLRKTSVLQVTFLSVFFLRLDFLYMYVIELQQSCPSTCVCTGAHALMYSALIHSCISDVIFCFCIFDVIYFSKFLVVLSHHYLGVGTKALNHNLCINVGGATFV